MIKIVFVIAMAMMSPQESSVMNQHQVAILPDELELPQGQTQVKKSRGKGRGQVPYFARYFK